MKRGRKCVEEKKETYRGWKRREGKINDNLIKNNPLNVKPLSIRDQYCSVCLKVKISHFPTKNFSDELKPNGPWRSDTIHRTEWELDYCSTWTHHTKGWRGVRNDSLGTLCWLMCWLRIERHTYTHTTFSSDLYYKQTRSDVVSSRLLWLSSTKCSGLCWTMGIKNYTALFMQHRIQPWAEAFFSPNIKSQIFTE